MRHLVKYIAAALFCGLAAAGCTSGKYTGPGEGRPVVFSVSVDGARTGSGVAPNYTADDYFGIAGRGNASVSAGSDKALYEYSAGTLYAASDDDVLRFPVDGSAVGISVSWPDGDVRENMLLADALSDQGTFDKFMSADWLSATYDNVRPAERVPVVLRHERSLLVFSVKQGYVLESLSFGTYTAWCNPETGMAYVTIDPVDDAGALSGSCTAAGQAGGFTFRLPSGLAGLEPGSCHPVILNFD